MIFFVANSYLTLSRPWRLHPRSFFVTEQLSAALTTFWTPCIASCVYRLCSIIDQSKTHPLSVGWAIPVSSRAIPERRDLYMYICIGEKAAMFNWNTVRGKSHTCSCFVQPSIMYRTTKFCTGTFDIGNVTKWTACHAFSCTLSAFAVIWHYMRLWRISVVAVETSKVGLRRARLRDSSDVVTNGAIGTSPASKFNCSLIFDPDTFNLKGRELPIKDIRRSKFCRLSETYEVTIFDKKVSTSFHEYDHVNLLHQ